MVLLRHARFALLSALMVTLLLGPAAAGAAGPGSTVLVDLPTGFGPLPPAGIQDSELAHGQRQLSDDGRFVVFASGSDGLLAAPGDAFVHVFRRDLLTGDVAEIDRGDGQAGAIGAGDATSPSVSADGAVVAFLTKASLIASDTNNKVDVYVRDVAAGTTTLVSRGDGVTGTLADDDAVRPAISGDGGRVAWDSEATNLGDGGVAGQSNVHERILATGHTLLLSRDQGGQPATGDSRSAALDQTGTVAAFTLGLHVYVRDLAAASTTLVDRGSGPVGTAADLPSGEPSISRDGHVVAFTSSATNLPGSGADHLDQVYVRDLPTSLTTLVSRADGPTGARASAASDAPQISGDGSAVAFISKAPSLASFVFPDTEQTWVRYLATGGTVFASRANGPSGAPSDAPTGTLIDAQYTQPSLNGDASCVLMRTRAPSFAAAAGVSSSVARAYLRVLNRECPFAAPETTIDSGPTGDVALGAAASFTFSANEPGSTFACRVDAAPFAPCTTPFAATASSAGTHTFDVRATDPAGFTDATPASASVTVVDLPPAFLSATMSNRTFKVGGRSTALTARVLTGTMIRYTLSKAANVTLTVQHLTVGRRDAGRCRTATHRLRYRLKCPLKHTSGTLLRVASRGGNAVNFSGKIGRRTLKPGRYQVILGALDNARHAAAPRTLVFRIAR